MGLFGTLLDMLMGMKVYDDCSNSKELTEEEELEDLVYLDQKMREEDEEWGE